MLQMPSARAALGLHQTPHASLATQQQRSQQAQQLQQQQSQAMDQAPAMPSPQEQTPGRGSPIDPVKLFDVPKEIKELAAAATDAHAMMLKVRRKQVHPSLVASQPD